MWGWALAGALASVVLWLDVCPHGDRVGSGAWQPGVAEAAGGTQVAPRQEKALPWTQSSPQAGLCPELITSCVSPLQAGWQRAAGDGDGWLGNAG